MRDNLFFCFFTRGPLYNQFVLISLESRGSFHKFIEFSNRLKRWTEAALITANAENQLFFDIMKTMKFYEDIVL